MTQPTKADIAAVAHAKAKQRALMKLKKLLLYDDTEVAHIEADAVLTDFIREIGHPEIADAFDKIGKWYS